MGLKRFQLGDFSGGLNTKDNPLSLKPNEARDLLNVIITERGALEQRAGKTLFSASGLPAQAPDHIRNWYPTPAIKFLMASINGTIYSGTVAGVFTSRFAGTAGTVWAMEQMQDAAGTNYLWAMNGTDTPQKLTSAPTASAWSGSPPNGTMMRVWKNRMCVAGVAANPQRLHYSTIGNPELPSPYNFVDIRTSEDDIDPITWLEVVGDFLIVFKSQSIWAVYDSNTFANRRLGSPGCVDRFMSCVSEGRLYWFHRSGVWSTDGNTEPRFESERIENLILDNVNYAQLSKVRMAASRDRRVFVALPFGASTTNNRLLELIPYLREGEDKSSNGAWTMHDYPVGALCSFRPANADVLVAGAAATNKIHTLFTGTNDDGAAITAYWFFGWSSIIGEEPFERLRRINVLISGDAVVEVYDDFSVGASFTAALVSPALTDPLWDGGTWDGGVWTAASDASLKKVRPETRARYHSIRFINTQLNKSFKIFQTELVFRGGKEH